MRCAVSLHICTRSVLVKVVPNQAMCVQAWSTSMQLGTCDFAFQDRQIVELRKGPGATPVGWQHACDTHHSSVEYDICLNTQGPDMTLMKVVDGYAALCFEKMHELTTESCLLEECMDHRPYIGHISRKQYLMQHLVALESDAFQEQSQGTRVYPHKAQALWYAQQVQIHGLGAGDMGYESCARCRSCRAVTPYTCDVRSVKLQSGELLKCSRSSPFWWQRACQMSCIQYQHGQGAVVGQVCWEGPRQ